MLYRLLLSDTGFIVGIIIEAVVAVVAVVLLILLLVFGLPKFKEKQPRAPREKKVKPSPEKYILKYASGEGYGEAPALEQYAKGDKVVLKSNMFEAPNGKLFDGWSDGEKKYESNKKFVMPAQAVTLTAQWTTPETKYALRYVAGEGSGEEPTVESYVKGARVVLKTNMFVTPAGKQFDGWSDGENKYASKFTFTMPAQAVTLTAQWVEPKKETAAEEEPKEKAKVAPAKKEQQAASADAPQQIDLKIDGSNAEYTTQDGGTTPDGRPIIVNVYNTHKNNDKTVEKEIIHTVEKEEIDNEGLEFADYTILQLYEMLTDEQKKYFDTLKEAALAKPEAKLMPGRSFLNIKIGKRSLLKLRIRRMVTVGEYSLENDILKDFKKSDTNKAGNAKIKVRPTLVAVTDESALETALNMIDLVYKQILES
ncbi:MAG: InlB B-repeat-containing protein [Corallococcus sp.]|nr:InlB B-repeat-containing protein [Bacillota bacterium]MCM1533839.1 InlB B-repeat-containing protein [Corallococcus sp.]